MELIDPEVRRKVAEAAFRHRAAEESVGKERKELRAAKEDARVRAEAHLFVTGVAEAVQRKVHHHLSGVVNDCLRAVFTAPEEFRVVFGKKRGRTEARLAFFRGGREVEDVGFGVKDVAAFGLRAAALLTRRPERRKLLVCDEPGRHLDQTGTRGRFREMLEGLAERLGIQMVVITQDPDLVGGRVVPVTPPRPRNRRPGTSPPPD